MGRFDLDRRAGGTCGEGEPVFQQVKQGFGFDAGNGVAEVVGKHVLRVTFKFYAWKCLLELLTYQVCGLSQSASPCGRSLQSFYAVG